MMFYYFYIGLGITLVLFFANIVMMLAPPLVGSEEDAFQAGNIMIFCVSVLSGTVHCG
jgi:hypothetical protein